MVACRSLVHSYACTSGGPIDSFLLSAYTMAGYGRLVRPGVGAQIEQCAGLLSPVMEQILSFNGTFIVDAG